MGIKELKKKIREDFGENEFYDLVSSEGDPEEEARFLEVVGLPFEYFDTERDYDTNYWMFKIGDKLYRCSGSYCSWGGTEMDDAFDFTEIKAVQKTITVYEDVA